jgi:RHS repeat-associated protein
MHRRRPLAVGLLVFALLVQSLPHPKITPVAVAAANPYEITTGKELPSVEERLGGKKDSPAVAEFRAPEKANEPGELRKDGSFTLPQGYVENPDATPAAAEPSNYGEAKRSGGKKSGNIETMRLDVSGSITTNTTWTLANSPYVVTSSVTVQSPAVLTIEPGVIVKFAAGTSLTATTGATLNADGTSTNPIIFTSIKDDAAGGDTNEDGTATSPAAGDWSALSISGHVDGQGAHAAFGSLTHVIARYGQKVETRFSKPTLTDTAISKMSQYALVLDTAPGTTWTPERLSLTDSNYGLYLYAMPSTTTVQHSSIQRNTLAGVTSAQNTAAKLTSNSIDYNKSWGVNGGSSMVLRYNSIAFNRNTNGQSLGIASTTAVDAQYNWWGSTSGPAVTGQTDTGGGSQVSATYVTYTNWLGKDFEEEHKKGDLPWAKKAGAGVDVASGNLVVTETDVSIPTIGFPLEVVRTYNGKTAVTNGTDFGAGWAWTYGTNLNVTADSYGGVLWEQPDGVRNYFKKHADGTFTPEEGIYSILTYDGTAQEYTILHKDQTRFVYNAAGKLIKQIDQDGNTTTIARATNGQIQTVTEPTGRQLTFTYTGNWITGITDPLGRTFTYTYGRTPDTLISYEKADASSTVYAQCAHNYGTTVAEMTSITDCDGNTLTMTYDSSKRVLTQKWNGNNTIRFVYGPATDGVTGLTIPSGATAVFDERAKAHIYYYTKANKVFEKWLEHSKSGGNYVWVTELQRSYDGYLTASESRAEYGTTATTYDERGNIVEEIAPGNRKTTYTYDAFNNQTTEKDNLNRITSYDYDAEHHLVKVTDPLTRETVTTYTTAGLPATVTDARSKVTTFTYDSWGYPETATNAENETLTFDYDAGGRKLLEETPTGADTIFTYNGRDQVLTVTDPLLNVTTTTYDAKGRKATVQDAEGRSTTYTYNTTRNLLWKTTDAKSGVVEFTYDNYGENLWEVKDALGHVTVFEYDDFKHKVGETDPNGKSTWTEISPMGRLLSSGDARGNTTTYTYNTANDLSQIAYQDAKTVAQTFDGVGNRLTMVDWLGTHTWTYDALNRVLTHTDASGNVIGYTYDEVGNVATITYPGSKVVTYTYDDANRIATVTDWDNRVTTYAYDTNGRMGSFTLPNGVTTTYGYDTASRVTAIDHVKSPTTIAALDYTFDDVGNRLTRTTGAGTETYTYDELYRLTNVAYANGRSTAYTYDATGNRLARTMDGQLTSHTYDNADQLTNAGDGLRVYDFDGQLTKVGSHLGYTWDARQQLTQITDSPSNTAPTANAGTNKSGYVTQLITLDGRASTDPEKEPLSYAWTEAVTNPATGLLRGAQTAQPGFTPTVAGSYVFKLTVNDGRTSSAISQVTVTVLSPAPSPQTLTVTAAAADSGFITTTSSSPGSFSNDVKTGMNTTSTFAGVMRFTLPTPPANTTLTAATLTLMGKSNNLNVAGDAWSVQLLPTSLDATFTTVASTTIAGATPDDTLSPVLTGTGQVVGGSADAWTFDANERSVVQSRLVGSGKLSIRTDGVGASNTSRVNWHGGNATNSANHPKLALTFTPNVQPDTAPIAIAGKDQQVLTNTLITLNGGASFDYQGAITHAWTAAASNPEAVTLSSSTAASPTFTPTKTGQYRFSLVVTDSASQTSVADEVLVNVVKELPSSTMSFVYNGDDDRVKQTKGGIDTTYVVNTVPKNEQVLMETTGSATTYHVYGHDLLYSIDAAGPHYLHADSLGSTVAVTDSTGAVEQTYDYDVFGVLRAAGGASGTRYTFTGEENDASGLVYLRARYYDPATGRFLSRDPSPADENDTQTLNRYVYVKNNPTNYVDPSGEYLTPGELAYGLILFNLYVGTYQGGGDLADAYRHAITSKRAAVYMGEEDARMLGMLNESAEVQKALKTGDRELLNNSQMDYMNNDVGIRAAKEGKPIDWRDLVIYDKGAFRAPTETELRRFEAKYGKFKG